MIRKYYRIKDQLGPNKTIAERSMLHAQINNSANLASIAYLAKTHGGINDEGVKEMLNDTGGWQLLS